MYVSRGSDMHLLLFHETVLGESFGENRDEGDMPEMVATFTTASISASSPTKAANTASTPGRALDSTRSADKVPEFPDAVRRIHSPSGDPRGGIDVMLSSSSSSDHRTAATIGKNGRFATAGRVCDYRMALRGAATHASKMKVLRTSFSHRLACSPDPDCAKPGEQ